MSQLREAPLAGRAPGDARPVEEGHRADDGVEGHGAKLRLSLEWSRLSPSTK
jgi:hypothetical protein